MLVVGTSAVVYPAAGLIEMALQLGATVIIINLEATPVCGSNTISIYGSSGTILPEIMVRLEENNPEH
jgi:NAD-dependent deacetylase